MTSRPRQLRDAALSAVLLTLAASPWQAGCAGQAPAERAPAQGTADATDERPRSASDASAPVQRVDASTGAATDPDDERADESEDDDAVPVESVADAGTLAPSAVDAGARQSSSDAGGDARARDAGPLPPLPQALTLHVAGDSTAAIFPSSDATHRVGWAAVLQSFFASTVRVNDAAQSGRSSKSYLDEGLWKALKAKIKVQRTVALHGIGELAHRWPRAERPSRALAAACRRQRRALPAST